MPADAPHAWGPARKIGDWAQEQVAADLRSRLSMRVMELYADPYFQMLDIDIYVEPQGGGGQYIEVKADSHTTRNGRLNAYIEVMSNVEKGTLGCMLTTQADLIYYYYVREGWVLLIDVKRLQEWMPRNLHRFESKFIKTGSYGKAIYTSEGKPVPVDVLVKEVGAVRLDGYPVMPQSTN